MGRFYYEQDGDCPKNSSHNEHYVVDSYADPCSDQIRTDIPWQLSGAKMRRAGINLAKQFNANPPWPVWDTIAAKRDNYKDTEKADSGDITSPDA